MLDCQFRRPILRLASQTAGVTCSRILKRSNSQGECNEQDGEKSPGILRKEALMGAHKDRDLTDVVVKYETVHAKQETVAKMRRLAK